MSKTENRIPIRRILNPADRQRLAALAETQSTAAAAALVGIHPQTYASLAAGIAAHRSTVALVERRLAELTAGGAK
jgi:hypothetical protein